MQRTLRQVLSEKGAVEIPTLSRSIVQANESPDHQPVYLPKPSEEVSLIPDGSALNPLELVPFPVVHLKSHKLQSQQ